jgi:hypothetical protein
MNHHGAVIGIRNCFFVSHAKGLSLELKSKAEISAQKLVVNSGITNFTPDDLISELMG